MCCPGLCASFALSNTLFSALSWCVLDAQTILVMGATALVSVSFSSAATRSMEASPASSLRCARSAHSACTPASDDAPLARDDSRYVVRLKLLRRPPRSIHTKPTQLLSQNNTTTQTKTRDRNNKKRAQKRKIQKSLVTTKLRAFLRSVPCL